MDKIKKVFEMSNWETNDEQIAYYAEISKLTAQERGKLIEMLHNPEKVSALITKKHD